MKTRGGLRKIDQSQNGEASTTGGAALHGRQGGTADLQIFPAHFQQGQCFGRVLKAPAASVLAKFRLLQVRTTTTCSAQAPHRLSRPRLQ